MADVKLPVKISLALSSQSTLLCWEYRCRPPCPASSVSLAPGSSHLPVTARVSSAPTFPITLWLLHEFYVHEVCLNMSLYHVHAVSAEAREGVGWVPWDGGVSSHVSMALPAEPASGLALFAFMMLRIKYKSWVPGHCSTLELPLQAVAVLQSL